jgi:hypothetical protein
MSIVTPARESGSPNAAPAGEGPEDGNGPDGTPVADAPGSREAKLPDATALEDRLPVWFRSTKALPLLLLPLGTIFFVVGSLPLWHTDLWGHLAYGRLIWETKSIPATEPFMPLARGVELVDTAWLSQVIGYLTLMRFGLPGLQFLAAACVTATAGVLAWLGYRKTGSIRWTALGLAAFVWLEWMQLFAMDMAVIIRPQLAGLVAFAVTLAVAVSRPRRWHWFVIPVTFAAWANLHGSFLAGLALLGVFALGRAGDVLRRTDTFGAILRDWTFWRLVLLTELAAAAVLLNPYGLRLYADAWLFAKNPNLQDLAEWDPLTLRMFQGQATAAVALALLFLYRMTPRRVGTGEALALLLFGGLALWTSRMIVWFGPVAAYCLTLHAAALWQAHRAKKAAPAAVEEEPLVPARRSLWTVAAFGLVWIFFALTPFAQRLLHGPDPKFDRAVSSMTPTGAAEYLRKNPRPGQVFNAGDYGDFLIWTNPGIPVFVAGHVHLIPTDVWRAYNDTISGAGWESILDRYGVNTIVLDKPTRQSFIDRLHEEPAWESKYEDRNSAVFVRREPLK